MREIKKIYARVEYGLIWGYTVHTRIQDYTDTHSVSVSTKSRILLYWIHLGKYCAVFRMQSKKYLI